MNDPKEVLKQSNLRVTQSRIAVLESLQACECSLSVDEILNSLKQKNQKVDKVTVYRMMDDFCEKNITKKIDFNDGVYRYELSSNHHHHLICESCGNVQVIKEHCLSIDEKDIKKKFDFVISHHVLEFYGICSNCI